MSRGVDIRVTANNSLYTTPALGQHVAEEDFPVHIGHKRIEKKSENILFYMLCQTPDYEMMSLLN